MTDILMIVLPIPIVLRLRMKWLAKLGLMAMFSMGFLFVHPTPSVSPGRHRFLVSVHADVMAGQNHGGVDRLRVENACVGNRQRYLMFVPSPDERHR